MPTKRPPRDVNELASYVVRVTIGEDEKIEPPAKNPAAVALGRLGGLKGGKARAETLTAKQRKRSAKKAALTCSGTQRKRISGLDRRNALLRIPQLHGQFLIHDDARMRCKRSRAASMQADGVTMYLSRDIPPYID